MKIELFENERASNYDTFVNNWIFNYHYFMGILPKILSKTNPKNILVVGCGVGNEIVELAQHNKEWQITGVDPSPEMIKQAKEKCKNFENVSFEIGTVNDLDNSQYDVATLLLVLHFMEDNGTKLQLLKDISSKLKPKAPFILFDITGGKEQLKDNLEIFSLLAPESATSEEIERRVFRIANELQPISEERLEELMIEAGFEKPVRFFQNTIYMGWITKKRENKTKN